LGLSTLLGGPQKFLEDMYLQFRLNQTPEEPYQNYAFILRSMTWPLVLMCVLGWIRGIREKTPGTLYHSLWFLLLFGFQTYFIDNKEARYLIFVIPPLYFFAANGTQYLLSLIAKLLQNEFVKIIAAWVALALILILPINEVFTEVRRFKDPIYREGFEREVSLFADELAGDNEILWIGPYYALHPKDYIFHIEDEFTSVYHFFNHVVRYYARRSKVLALGSPRFLPPGPGQTAIFVGPNIAHYAHPGDVLIINVEETPHKTDSIPKDRRPLIMQRLQAYEFVRDRSRGGDNQILVAPLGLPNAILEGISTPQGFLLAGKGIPDGRYELYLQIKGIPRPESLALIDVTGGQFAMAANQLGANTNIQVAALIYYDNVRVFIPPSMTITEGRSGKRL